MRVLVVDDEIDLAEAAALVLEWAGHTAAIWNPREPIVRAIGRFRPDVVVLDWVLGGPSGGEVLLELRADPLLAAIPVVVMSALHGVEASARTLGARYFIAKPFEPAELVRAVDACAMIHESPTMPP